MDSNYQLTSLILYLRWRNMEACVLQKSPIYTVAQPCKKPCLTPAAVMPENMSGLALHQRQPLQYASSTGLDSDVQPMALSALFAHHR